MSNVFRVLNDQTNLLTRFFYSLLSTFYETLLRFLHLLPRTPLASRATLNVLPSTALYLVICTLYFVPNTLNAQQPKIIQIINADEAIYDEAISSDAQILKGNVHMIHNEVKMWCDSAYLYQKSNILKAFSNVRMNQGDTVLLNSDYLEYSGDTRIANATGNVTLDEKAFHLTTPAIVYNLKNSLATYQQSGIITSKENNNTLNSKIGIYNSKTKYFFFKKDVVLTNPEYVVKTDTMDYNTISEVAYFFGPTEITADSNFLYCENGFYDTKANVSAFKKNAYLVSNAQTLKGDSLHYDRDKGIGRAFENVCITDTTNDFEIQGQYAIYFEKTDSSLITKQPKVIKFFESDSLYLRADTVYTIKDTNELKTVYAFHHVLFFKTDIQGICDTLFFTQNDSTLTMIDKPILWHEKDQISGERIIIYADSSEIKKLYINKQAMIIEEAGIDIYNQIKGKQLWAYFKDNNIYKMDINGNGETVYYAFDEAKNPPTLTGINKAYCSNMQVLFANQEISSINFKVKPQSTMHPPKDIAKKADLFILKGFEWLQHLRPSSAQEIMTLQSETTKFPSEEQSTVD